MTRQRRLASARSTRWLETYAGKNVIAGYAKWFGVDLLCALIELRALGVHINSEREDQIKANIEARAADKKRRQKLRAQVQASEFDPDSDDRFAYIAGYTSGGAPYGTTWEDLSARSGAHGRGGLPPRSLSQPLQ